MYSFPYLEPVCCSMSSSNCCFLTYIQISQEADQMVWYSHLFQNFSEFVVVHTVKGFDIVNKTEIDVFLELSCFFDDPMDVGNLISGSSAFSKTVILPFLYIKFCKGLEQRWLLKSEFIMPPDPSQSPLKLMANIYVVLTCARHYSKLFTCIYSVNLRKEVSLLIL